MTKHVLKIANYPENEAFILCPKKNFFALVKMSFPLTCPKCGEVFKTEKDIKFVLREDLKEYLK
ncbi:MAG: hypothetical protein QXH91_08885 [Candidatus Bathyarchaeia archaeon]